jgi:hypothetical protein
MPSAIPATLTALVALWDGATGPEVDVRGLLTLSGDVGSPTDNIWRRVSVGELPETGDSLDFNREWANVGNRRVIEAFDIPCYIECLSGDEDLMPLAAAAFDLFDDLSAALAADNTLGGLVMQGAAILGRGSLSPREVEKGASIGLTFTVHCETRINQ